MGREVSGMLTLYDFGNSVCCQKVRITLVEKGLTWEARRSICSRPSSTIPNISTQSQGVVPTLVHDGIPIIESTLICEYLDDMFPDPPLVPKHPAERARMRLWSKFVDEGLFDGVTELSFSAMFRERMRAMSLELREKRFRNVGDPRRTDRFKSTYEHGVHSPFVLHAIAAYERAFKLMEQTLAERGPWLLGKSPTLADINLMPFAARLSYLGLLEAWTAGRPHINEWWARAGLAELPAGLHDLITEAEFTEMRTHGPKIRADVEKLIAGLRTNVALV
jgi:glutathione S-transferase